MSLDRPDWNCKEDRKLYDELFYQTPYLELTEKDKEFVTTMYHFEEYATGNG